MAKIIITAAKEEVRQSSVRATCPLREEAGEQMVGLKSMVS